ncbi:MAG: hypothetical protein KDI03_09585 [Anaerolineae bacterium]|nr:hypothetical protein [Anaerolineae bacterium]
MGDCLVLLAETLLWVPILIRIVVPNQATRVLDSTSAWMTKNNRVLMTVVVLGLYFLFAGDARLLA